MIERFIFLTLIWTASWKLVTSQHRSTRRGFFFSHWEIAWKECNCNSELKKTPLSDFFLNYIKVFPCWRPWATSNHQLFRPISLWLLERCLLFISSFQGTFSIWLTFLNYYFHWKVPSTKINNTADLTLLTTIWVINLTWFQAKHLKWTKDKV